MNLLSPPFRTIVISLLENLSIIPIRYVLYLSWYTSTVILNQWNKSKCYCFLIFLINTRINQNYEYIIIIKQYIITLV